MALGSEEVARAGPPLGQQKRLSSAKTYFTYMLDHPPEKETSLWAKPPLVRVYGVQILFHARCTPVTLVTPLVSCSRSAAAPAYQEFARADTARATVPLPVAPYTPPPWHRHCHWQCGALLFCWGPHYLNFKPLANTPNIDVIHFSNFFFVTP